MVAAAPARRRPYRRRVLVIGLTAAALVAAAGAPWYVARVERDLEGRVEAAASAAGLPVTVTASGQDVRLSCAAALDDPRAAVDAAAAVRGVRGIAVDRSCRVDEAADDSGRAAATGGSGPGTTATPGTATTPSSAPPGSSGASASSASSASSGSSASSASSDSTGSSAGTVAPTDFATVADVVAAGPQFSILDGLLRDSGLASELRGSGPFTLLAPTDDAFGALPADSFAAVRNDPEQLAALLRRHVVAGDAVSAADLAGAPLVALDGSTRAVTALPDGPAVDGANVVAADLAAGNGMVHALDAVLVPADGALAELAPDGLRAVLDDGQLLLAGAVASELQHLRLVEAATRRLDPANITDELVLDPAAPVDDPTLQAYAELVAVMPGNLADGMVRAGRAGLSITGTHIGDEGRAAVDATASVVDADVALSPRPAATPSDVAVLTDELDELLAESPIAFEPLSATISGSSAAVLDRIAGTLAGLSGLLTTIEGHTDTTGAAADNLVLGELRAQSVLLALAARGVPATDLGAVGRGESEPVLVDGVEDPVASRRVELRVDLTGDG